MPIHDNQKSYVCLHIFENTRPVKLVVRDADGWCFLCGDLHPETADSFRVVGAGHLLERDPSLKALDDLEEGWEAERESTEGEWIITPSVTN
jgi:hypothetical protein